VPSPKRAAHGRRCEKSCPEVRAPLIALGKRYGCVVIGYYFLPDVAGSVKRNAAREGKAKVPPVAIYATRKKLQPPTYAEGFDQLYAVRIADESGFQIQPLPCLSEETADE
jgi:hypothetical protein